MDNNQELNELAKSLKNYLECGTRSDGRLDLSEKTIDIINSLRIEVRGREHPPAHFHVICDRADAFFRIDNCEQIEGEIGSKELKSLKAWYDKYKQKLIDEWNKMRPSDCIVGEI